MKRHRETLFIDIFRMKYFIVGYLFHSLILDDGTIRYVPFCRTVRPVVVLLGLIVNFPGMGDMFSHQSRTLVLDCGIWKSLKRLILNGDEVVLIGGIS